MPLGLFGCPRSVCWSVSAPPTLPDAAAAAAAIATIPVPLIMSRRPILSSVGWFGCAINSLEIRLKAVDKQSNCPRHTFYCLATKKLGAERRRAPGHCQNSYLTTRSCFPPAICLKHCRQRGRHADAADLLVDHFRQCPNSFIVCRMVFRESSTATSKRFAGSA